MEAVAVQGLTPAGASTGMGIVDTLESSREGGVVLDEALERDEIVVGDGLHLEVLALGEFGRRS